jgi:predicted MFS family arabinose efflux permease
MAFYPVIFAQHISVFQIGIMYAVAAVPVIILSPIVGRIVQRHASALTMTGASLLLLLIVAIISLPERPVLWFVFLTCASIVFAVVETGGLTLMVSEGPSSETYVVATALWGVVYDVAYGLSPSAVGFVAEGTTVRIGVWSLITIIGLGIVATALIIHRWRNRGLGI